MTGTSRDMTGERPGATSPIYAVYGTIDPDATTTDALIAGGMVLRQIPLDLVIELDTGSADLQTRAIDLLSHGGGLSLLGAVGFDDWWTDALTVLNPDFALGASRRLVIDKGLLYTQLAEAGIPVPQVIRGRLNAHLIQRAVDAFGPRPILKPATGAGSRGVYRYRDDLTADDNLGLYCRLLTVGHIDSGVEILAVDYLGGAHALEVSVDVIAAGTEIIHMVVHEKLTSTEVHPFVDRVMVSPPINPTINATAADLHATVLATVKALGIVDAALHIELRLHGDRWHVLDAGVRPGSGLVAHSVQARTGVDPRAVHLLASIGRPLTATAARRPCGTSDAVCIACCYITDDGRDTATFADHHSFANTLAGMPSVIGWHLNAASTNDAVFRPDAGLSVGVGAPDSMTALTRLQAITERHHFSTS